MRGMYSNLTNIRRKLDAMKKLDIASAVLLIVGGLNWGLVAVANFDLVATIFGLNFGQTNVATRIVYGLAGLAAVYQLTQLRALPARWGARRHAMAS
jgi:uncharacterized membrane protein YuzA (DUF378 family)